MPRANRAEVEERTTATLKMLVAGEPTPRILQFAAEKWQLSPRQAHYYVARANSRLAEQAQVDRALEYGKARARLEDLYNSCVKIKDYRTALSVERDLVKLMNLTPPPSTPPTPITLKTPSDVLAVIVAELNAVIAGTSDPARSKALQDLAVAAIRTMDQTDTNERLNRLEELQGIKHHG